MGGMAALGVASSRGSGSHSRCKLSRHSELAGSWLSVSQTHLVAVVFFLVWATGTLPGCCMAFGTAQVDIAPGAVVVPCLHGACLHRHCAKIALLLQKPPKRGFQHQGPQHHSPEVTPGAGGEVLVFFPAVLKLGLWKLRAIPERGGFRSKIFPSVSPQPRACITTQSQPRARWVPTLSWGRSPQGEQGGSGEQALHSQAAVGVKHAGRERGAFAAPVPPWRPPRSGAHPGEVRIQRAWPRSEPVLGCRMRPAAAPCFLCCIFSPPEFGFVCVSAGFSPAFASRAVTAQMVAERLSTPWRGTGSVAGLEAV